MDSGRSAASNRGARGSPPCSSLGGWCEGWAETESLTLGLLQMGEVLRDCWGGQAFNMVKAAKQSAIALVRLIVSAFPGPFLFLSLAPPVPDQ